MTTLTTTLAITGMSCGSCVHHVDAALRHVTGVTSVVVDHTAARARVLHGKEINSAALIAAITEAGYEAAVVP